MSIQEEASRGVVKAKELSETPLHVKTQNMELSQVSSNLCTKVEKFEMPSDAKELSKRINR